VGSVQSDGDLHQSDDGCEVFPVRRKSHLPDRCARHQHGRAARHRHCGFAVSILGRNPDAIKARIDDSADQIGSIQMRGFYGNGRLNVARAVGAIP